MSFQIISANLNLYLRHAIGIPEQFLFVVSTVQGAAFVFIGLFYLLLRKVSDGLRARTLSPASSAAASAPLTPLLRRQCHWEKKTCYTIGLVMYLPITVGFYCEHSGPAESTLGGWDYLPALGS